MAVPNVNLTDRVMVHHGASGEEEYELLSEVIAGGGGVVAREVLYVENGAGTYTGSVTVPPGAYILDIVVHAVALWTAATSAAMIVGDVADPNGYFDDVNLKATDLLAGESISFSHQGGQGGADFIDTNTHVGRRYLSTERVISGVITSVGAGTAGRTRMVVVYVLPTSVDATTATKA